MSTRYERGRALEYRAIRTLKAAGFSVMRSAGSKGLFDLAAWTSKQVRFIQCKSVSCKLSAVDRELIEAEPVPDNATREVWTYYPGRREPVVEVI